jgi:AraC-like DNA-binding protein
MDPLSDVLSLIRPRGFKGGGFDGGGDLCLSFPAFEGILCYAVVSGECQLSVEGGPEAVRLAAGDCVVLPRGRPFRLASDLALAPTDALALMSDRPVGGVTTWGGGGRCFIVGGHFGLEGASADVLLGILPPVVHIRKQEDRAALRWSLERMMRELREPRPGGALVIEHLAHLMLVQALRLHLAEGLEGGVGWLFALADRRMSAAIGALHADPARRWTLQDLAQAAGMSRTSFALRFKATVGTSAMDYLTRWRMLLAGASLANAREPVSVVARSLGYESESAFSTAFKRVMGCPPRRYARREVPAAAPARGALVAPLREIGAR